MITAIGMYTNGNGDIFKVQRSKSSGHLYAKRLVVIGGDRLVDADESVVNFDFEYAPGAVRDLTDDQRMTREQAAAFGLRFGICCVCGKTLTDAESVKNGIGPVCIKQFDAETVAAIVEQTHERVAASKIERDADDDAFDAYEQFVAEQPHKCDRCGGTGQFITGSVNGKLTGPGGICYRCNGKGVQTRADERRNYGYDNFFMRVA